MCLCSSPAFVWPISTSPAGSNQTFFHPSFSSSSSFSSPAGHLDLAIDLCPFHLITTLTAQSSELPVSLSSVAWNLLHLGSRVGGSVSLLTPATQLEASSAPKLLAATRPDRRPPPFPATALLTPLRELPRNATQRNERTHARDLAELLYRIEQLSTPPSSFSSAFRYSEASFLARESEGLDL